MNGVLPQIFFIAFFFSGFSGSGSLQASVPFDGAPPAGHPHFSFTILFASIE